MAEIKAIANNGYVEVWQDGQMVSRIQAGAYVVDDDVAVDGTEIRVLNGGSTTIYSAATGQPLRME